MWQGTKQYAHETCLSTSWIYSKLEFATLRKATCSWQRLYRKAPDRSLQQSNPEVY